MCGVSLNCSKVYKWTLVNDPFEVLFFSFVTFKRLYLLIQFLFVLQWLINISQIIDMDRIDMKMLGLQITPKYSSLRLNDFFLILRQISWAQLIGSSTHMILAGVTWVAGFS